MMAVSEQSMKRYIEHASYRCYQELLSDSRADEREGWKPVKSSKFGIAISRRRDGRKTIVRGQCVLNISAAEFQAVANAIDTAKQWDRNFKEAQCLHRLDDNIRILRLAFGGEAGPLFKNREFIVHERREVMDDGTVVVGVASLPKEMAAGISPPTGGRTVRGMLLYSGWVVEQIEHSNACMVTYIVQMDAGGWFPKCITNILVVRLVFVIYQMYVFLTKCH